MRKVFVFKDTYSSSAVQVINLKISKLVLPFYLLNTAIKFIFFPEVSLSVPLPIKHSPFKINSLFATSNKT